MILLPWLPSVTRLSFSDLWFLKQGLIALAHFVPMLSFCSLPSQECYWSSCLRFLNAGVAVCISTANLTCETFERVMMLSIGPSSRLKMLAFDWFAISVCPCMSLLLWKWITINMRFFPQRIGNKFQFSCLYSGSEDCPQIAGLGNKLHTVDLPQQ